MVRRLLRVGGGTRVPVCRHLRIRPLHQQGKPLWYRPRWKQLPSRQPHLRYRRKRWLFVKGAYDGWPPQTGLEIQRLRALRGQRRGEGRHPGCCGLSRNALPARIRGWASTTGPAAGGLDLVRVSVGSVPDLTAVAGTWCLEQVVA